MNSYQDLDNAFKLYLDKVDSQGVADFLPREREKFLNDAQSRLVTRLLAPRKLTQEVQDQLRSLFVEQAQLKAKLTRDQESYRMELPKDYRRFSRLRVGVQSSFTQQYYTVAAKMVSQDELSSMLQDPFNKTSISEPVAAMADNAILVYNDSSYRVTAGGLSYYRSPSALSYLDKVGSELSEELMPELVELAVYLAKKSIESPDAPFQAQTLTPLI